MRILFFKKRECSEDAERSYIIKQASMIEENSIQLTLKKGKYLQIAHGNCNVVLFYLFDVSKNIKQLNIYFSIKQGTTKCC